jgi:hypothetical protein
VFVAPALVTCIRTHDARKYSSQRLFTAFLQNLHKPTGVESVNYTFTEQWFRTHNEACGMFVATKTDGARKYASRG